MLELETLQDGPVLKKAFRPSAAAMMVRTGRAREAGRSRGVVLELTPEGREWLDSLRPERLATSEWTGVYRLVRSRIGDAASPDARALKERLEQAAADGRLEFRRHKNGVQCRLRAEAVE